MAAKKQNKGKVGGAKPAARGTSKSGAKAKQTKASAKPSAAKSKPGKSAATKSAPAKGAAVKSTPAKKAAKPAKAKVSAAKKPAKKPAPAKAKTLPAKKAPPAKAKAPAKKPPAKADLAKQKAELAKQKAAQAKEKAQLQKQKEREKALALKEREKALAAKEREKALALKAKEQDKLRKQKEQAQLQKQKEREKLQKEREKALAEKEREKALALKAKEKAAAAERARKEKEAEKERIRLEKEAEKERIRLEKEAEKERIRLEKERVREEARLKKEEERRQKDAEREAYRKAREAEREKLRAEKEAARRALEGKVARQNRQAQRIAGVGRGGTSRVYRPDTVPDQSRTTRRSMEGTPVTPRQSAATSAAPPSRTPTPLRPTPPRRILPDRVEARHALIQQRLGRMPDRFRQDYAESFDMSWIHHDSALEGVVYTYQELKTAIDPNITVVPDSSLQPVCEEIRRHKAAIDWVRDQGEKKRAPITVDTIKKLYVLLHPEEGDVKTVKYRREIPQHRLYFHEYAPPDKIGHRVRQVVEWFNGPEPKKLKDPVRVAARVHYDLLRVFPFQHDSGKVSRLLMNLILIRSDLPPVIIHSTERQRYYDALKGTLPVIVSMVNDSMRNALASIEKVLDEEELKIPGLEPLSTGSEAYAPVVRPVRRSISRSSAAALEDDENADGDSDDDSDSDDDD